MSEMVIMQLIVMCGIQELWSQETGYAYLACRE